MKTRIRYANDDKEAGNKLQILSEETIHELDILKKLLKLIFDKISSLFEGSSKIVAKLNGKYNSVDFGVSCDHEKNLENLLINSSLLVTGQTKRIIQVSGKEKKSLKLRIKVLLDDVWKKINPKKKKDTKFMLIKSLSGTTSLVQVSGEYSAREDEYFVDDDGIVIKCTIKSVDKTAFTEDFKVRDRPTVISMKFNVGSNLFIDVVSLPIIIVRNSSSQSTEIAGTLIWGNYFSSIKGPFENAGSQNWGDIKWKLLSDEYFKEIGVHLTESSLNFFGKQIFRSYRLR